VPPRHRGRRVLGSLLAALFVAAACSTDRGDRDVVRERDRDAARDRRRSPLTSTPAGYRDLSQRVAWLWPFANDSPWNQALGTDARYSPADDPRVTNLIDAAFTPWVNTDTFSHPVVLARRDDPEVEIRYRTSNREPTRDGSAWIQVPEEGAEPAAGSDAHLHVVTPDGREVHEMFRASWDDGRLEVSYYVRTDLTGRGVGEGGTRAFGGSAIGGLLRTWELEAGEIRHVVALALHADQLRRGWVAPATTEDGDSNDSYGGEIPMGTHVAIPPTPISKSSG
jgi:hypothetical protein